MARGWESKSIEAQIEDNKSTPSKHNPELPVSREEVQRNIRRADLHLSRKRVLQQLEGSTNERYTDLLRRSLAELDGQLSSES